MKGTRRTTGLGAACGLILLAGACGRQAQTSDSVEPQPAQQRPDSAEMARRPAPALPGRPPQPPGDPSRDRQIPFDGALDPAAPPPAAAPPPRPLAPSDRQSLDVLYSRPSPMGPPPIQREQPRAIMVAGKGPIFSQLPGVPAFAEKYPAELLEAEGGQDLFSNDNNVELPKGTVRFVSFDRTVNDSKLSKDSMAFEATITDHEGAEWRIVQTRLAPISPDPVNDPWYGGLAIDTLEHGNTGPRSRCVQYECP